MKIGVFSISDIENTLNEEGLDVEEYLNGFTVKVNPDIQDFFCKFSLLRNNENVCRTFVVLDMDNTTFDNIIGYFSITITYRKINRGVSNKLKKKISSEAVKHNMFSAVLITKLGRSDKYKGLVSGSKIMDLALDKCYQIYELTGLRHVCVDYYENEKLEEFYINKKDFKQYQVDTEKKLNYCFYKFE